MEKLRTFIISQSCSIYNLPSSLIFKSNFKSPRVKSQGLYCFSRSKVLHLEDMIGKFGSFSSSKSIASVQNSKIVLCDRDELFIYDIETEKVCKISKNWRWPRDCYAAWLNKPAFLIAKNGSTHCSLSVVDSDESVQICFGGVVLAACSAIGTSNIYLSIFNPFQGKQMITKFSTLEDIKLLEQHFISTKTETALELPDMYNLLNFQVISHTDNSLTIWALIHQASVTRFLRYGSDRQNKYRLSKNLRKVAVHLNEILQNSHESETLPCTLVELILSENNANVQEQVIACGNDRNYNCEFCNQCRDVFDEWSFSSCRNYHKRHIDCNTYNIDLNSKSCIAFNGVDIIFVSDYTGNAVHQFCTDGSYIGKCLGPLDGIESPICITFDNEQLLVAKTDKVHTFIITNLLKGKLNNVVIKRLLCSYITSVKCLDHNGRMEHIAF